jgi:glycosyltransferase involved in cell wall biosynthesis
MCSFTPLHFEHCITLPDARNAWRGNSSVALWSDYSPPSTLTNAETKISVCHIVAGDSWAGAEVQVASLLKYLAKYPNVAVHAISLSDARFARELEQCGVDTYVVRQKHKSFLQVIRECSEFVASRNVEIIHSHKYKENIVGLLTAWRSKIPYVIRTAHGCPEPYSRLRQPKHWLALTVDRMCTVCIVDHVIAVSSEMAEHYQTFVNSSKITVIHNGVDRERVVSPLSQKEAKERLGITPEHFVIGTVGRLEPVKRHDLFVAVARRVADRLPSARFLIAGSGHQESWLTALVTASGLQHHVLLLGERQDIYDVLRAMDIVLICSDHEGLPTVMLEAMVLGVPVVARDVGGIPEVLQHGINGVLVRSADPDALARACMQLYWSNRVRTRLAEAASHIADCYSAEKMADKVVQLYRSFPASESVMRSCSRV